MSVYGNDISMDRGIPEDPQEQKDPEPSIGQLSINSPNNQTNHSLPFPVYHRGSVTSITTTSSTSSPATNYSSPLFTDPSPSSSPESASSSNPPLSPFRNAMQSTNHDRSRNDDDRDQARTMPPPSYVRSGSPARNVKNLSLNMNTVVSNTRPATSHGAENRMNTFSAPASPLKEPLRSARKKPTNLTIRTPGFNQLSFPRAGEVPPTPSSRPAFPTLQSSPSLPSLQTPTTSSSSGLHLSLPSFSSGHSRPGSDSSFSSHQSAAQLPDLKEEDEPRRSFEAPERGYPEGPIQIYDCGVWLYLEPKAEEAKEFDTVINVAKEIKNPFEHKSPGKETVMSVWRSNRNSMVEPQTAMSEFSFKSAWEVQPVEVTPTTPRPSSAMKNDPEYLHVPWDHNSEILEDLWPLCCVIDERVKAGKRVLIHCQLGVSRSASLIIAYGLFKGYQRDFHSMYQQVKGRSRWVGPNMSLIYQLSDFRANVEKGAYTTGARGAPSHWFKYSPPDSLSFRDPQLSHLRHGTEASHQSDHDPAKTPTAKPLRSLRLDKNLPPVPLFPKEEEPMTDMPQRPAAATAPKSNAAPPTPPRNEPAPKKQSTDPRPLPFRTLAEYANPATIPPHRPKVGVVVPPVRTHISRPSMDLASQDVPETPSLFSPRATEFLASPFGISKGVGELTVGNGPRSARSFRSIPPPTPSPGFIGFTHIRAPTMQETPVQVALQGTPQVPVAIDPRSPHQSGETREILRHIDDFL
jgi:tyrosine-protein phosphatase MSG5